MAQSREEAMAELARLEAAYRKSRWTIIGHGIFLFLCCLVAIVVRRMAGLPPALLTGVFIVALLLFGGDFFRFVNTRRRLQRLREELD
jgi:hypothetical protein